VHTSSRQQWRRTVAALAIAASSVLSFGERAEAHAADDCSENFDATACNHRRTWAEATVYIVARPNFLAQPASWTDRLRDARDNWPPSTGRPGLSVTSIGPASACESAGDPTYTAKINVFYGSVQANGGPAGALGMTCMYPSAMSGEGYRMRRADLIIDDGHAWSSSGAADIPSTDWDLESILTHELGHALGLHGHFDNYANGVDDSACGAWDLDWNTMCPGTGNALGTVRLRTTEPHDQGTQINAY